MANHLNFIPDFRNYKYFLALLCDNKIVLRNLLQKDNTTFIANLN